MNPRRFAFLYMSRRHLLLALALLSMGVWLRFHGLERQSLWDDEMSTRKVEYMPTWLWPAYFHVYEMHPPLYFLQLRVWQGAFGSSLKALRANSAFWGSLTLILLFLLVRQYQGDSAALLAMALLAVSPYHLAYSQEMRPYAMGAALGVLGFLLLEKKQWIWLTVIMIAEMYTHYWGSFLVASQLVCGFLQAETPAQRKAILICGLLACAVFALWLPMLRAQLQAIPSLSFWVPPASPVNLARTAVAYTGLFFHHASLAFRAPGPIGLHILIGAVTFAAAVIGIRKGPRAAWIWLSVGLGLPYLISYVTHSIYVWYRYPFLIYPAFVVLVACGLSAIRIKPLRWAMTGALLLMNSWSVYAYHTTWQKANPKDVVAYVQTLKQPDTVVVRPDYFAPLFAYYDIGPTAVIDQHKLSDPVKRAALKGKSIIFLAFDVPDDPVRDALLSQFSVTSRRDFPGYAHLAITVYQLK